MNAWVVRGLGMALIHILVRVLLGAAITQWPLQGSILRWVALLVVVLVALIWAGIDGIRDRHRNPDPDQGADLTMLWLKAALLGGIVAGVGSWLADLLPSLNVTQNSFFFEITSGAAFTVLLIFVPAMLAVFLGRFFAGRDAKKASQGRGGDRDARRGAGSAAGAAAGGTAAAAVADDNGYGQHYPDGTYDQSGYADPDADTAVFEPVHNYRQDTSDLDAGEGQDTTWQEPVDLGKRNPEEPKRGE
ncbi:B-4DMT family transporter [Rhodococcus sp. NPDC019627]|uniref:B-4DMT family transporter n=1 Tax=unclassified Rhodococcus (in: high G+C Gram-positive bacteria) TaxID=192944 RepID=UPI0033DB2527